MLTPRMGRFLGSFKHMVSRQIMGRRTKRWEGGGWEYPQLEIVMKEAGFQYMVDYVLKRNNTTVQYIAMRPILDLCEKTV